jgi:hypothetical protein
MMTRPSTGSTCSISGEYNAAKMECSGIEHNTWNGTSLSGISWESSDLGIDNIVQLMGIVAPGCDFCLEFGKENSHG